MKKNTNVIVVLFVIGLAVLSGIALGRYSSGRLAVEPIGGACSVTMTDIIASAQGDVYSMEGDSEYVEPKSNYLVKYSVEGDAIKEPFTGPFPSDFADSQKDTALPNDLVDEQNDTASQNTAWDVFTALIPAQDRQMVVQYNVFTDGYSNTLAAVDQSREDAAQWVLEIDIADLEDKDSFLFTLIHEYAHLLTLNALQVIPDQEIVDSPKNLSLQEEKDANCSTYFTGTGCSYKDSYINTFYNRFWLDINNEWIKIDVLQYNPEDSTPYYDGLYSFYKSHQDQFVDDYATTHPTEDIAESFAYFVFNPKPIGNSIKEQKIAFFYEYPELVQLREHILSGACSLEK